MGYFYQRRPRYTRRRYHRPQFRYRRYYRRRYYPRRRRRHFHWRKWRRTEVLREHRPRKTKWITVTGWEIMGHVGSALSWVKSGQDYSLHVRRNIKNTVKVDHLSKMGITNDNKAQGASACDFKDFCGGYGEAQFTLAGLVQRSRACMARFSESLGGYDWIKFIGGSVTLPPSHEVNYLFRWDNHRGGNDKEREIENVWNHPANMLLFPMTVIVESIERTKCCKWRRIKFKPPPAFEGWWDKDVFATFILGGYQWTTIDLDNPLGLAPYTQNVQTLTTQYKNEWFKKKGPCPEWIDRSKYNKDFNESNTIATSWLDWVWGSLTTDKVPKYSPFCPPVYPTQNPQTLWFKYKFHFKVGGANLENRFEEYPIHEVNQPPQTCPTSCSACINPEDLDSDGLLTERAYRRITEPDNQSRILHQIRHYLRRYIRRKQREQQKHVSWGRKQTRYFRQ